MLDIDFLPAQYHRRQARKRSKPWQVVVVLAFTTIVAVAAVGQFRRHAALRAELDLLAPQYEQAVAANDRLAKLQTELKEARAEATLLTYLRHPWPRTQLLRALLEPLPDEILLSELEITTGTAAAQRPAQRRPQTDDEKEALAALTPAGRDLAELREQADTAPTIMRVRGATSDSAVLQHYLGALAQRTLVRKAELESSERVEREDGRNVHFRATVVVRPGYGQPGGPTRPDQTTTAGRGPNQ